MKQTKNQQIKSSYEMYKRCTNGTNLFNVYNSFSSRKYNALEYCKKLMLQYDGTNGQILTSNTFAFTFGFTGKITDEKTGETKKAYFYITKDYDRYMILN